jgi:hypothetical protein
MRFPYVAVLASLLVATACARGEGIDGTHVEPIDDTGGENTDPGDQGGAAGSGGTTGNGGVVGNGGTLASGGTPISSGGKAGSGNGGKASGGSENTGGRASGGAGGSVNTGGNMSGGRSGTGGAASGGSTSGGASSVDAGSCKTGEKVCGSICTPPAPRIGCGLTGCDACTVTAPANGYVTCANNQCVFDCLSGFTKMGTMCVGSSTGGGGTGSGSCNPSRCPQNCSVVFGPACCTSAGKCGCPAIPYVAPTCVGA